MFRSFIKAATRYILNYQIFTIINVLGLTIGIASSLLIYLYLTRELSYDKFHLNSDHIYRIGVKGKLKGAVLNQAISSPAMAGTLNKEFDEIIETVRIGRYGAWLVSYDNVRYNEDNLLFADSNFFKMFSFNLIKGDPDKALAQPNSIILTQETVMRFFGSEDPMGKMLRIENDTTFYKVTGVMENVPSNSHMQFDMIASLITLKKALHDYWVSHNLYTYILVEENTDIHLLENKLNKLVARFVVPQLNSILGMPEGDFESAGNSYNFFVQPLEDIHLRSNLNIELEQNGNIIYVYIFSVLAILILFIVSINFMNLSTARAAQRAKEVGIRKMAGSDKMLLIRQFLTEAVLLSILAMTMALLLVEIVLPQFNKYIGLNLNVKQLATAGNIVLLLIFSVVLGLIAGSYPAFFLASYQPIDVLRKRNIFEPGNIGFRKGLVFFQFFVTVFVIIVTFILFDQYKYLISKDLGFDKENLLIIRRSDAVKSNNAGFREEILANKAVNAVTYSSTIPGKHFSKSSFIVEGMPSKNSLLMYLVFVSEDFQKTYGLEMRHGSFFTSSNPFDSLTCVVNESAAKLIDPVNATGHIIRFPMSKESMMQKKEQYTITGVVKDFNFSSLEEEIGPLVMFPMPPEWEGYFTVKVSPDSIGHTVDFLREKWGKYTDAYPFVYYMLNDDLTAGYHLVRKTARILSVFSFITILVAFIGLYGLASFTSNLRKREVGIRKVLGATEYTLVKLLIKQIVLLILIASTISAVTVFFLSHRWLAYFHYHVSLNPGSFVLPVCIILAMATVTVVAQACFTAGAKPGEILKAE
ncbi:MAG: ABC transporter permease [Bacteroidales bacterium]|nr:ABC transporter permease [Bacteroidales bacterium]